MICAIFLGHIDGEDARDVRFCEKQRYFGGGWLPLWVALPARAPSMDKRLRPWYVSYYSLRRLSDAAGRCSLFDACSPNRLILYGVCGRFVEGCLNWLQIL